MMEKTGKERRVACKAGQINRIHHFPEIGWENHIPHFKVIPLHHFVIQSSGLS
jgi:hypothetical protein